ncbi:MAG: hypothetical protein DKINENOH_04802 [bacterium]|nr:hypothetical protein [bacterium]
MMVRLPPYLELAAELRKHGFVEHADNLEAMPEACDWLTSAEFVHAMGQAIISFQREHPIVPADLQDMIDRCMEVVKSVWPEIR